MCSHQGESERERKEKGKREKGRVGEIIPPMVCSYAAMPFLLFLHPVETWYIHIHIHGVYGVYAYTYTWFLKPWCLYSNPIGHVGSPLGNRIDLKIKF